MKDTEIAWLAGIIEGEGTFFKRGAGRSKGLYVFALEMCDKDIVERACFVFGYGNVKPAKVRGLGKKDRWIWRFEKCSELCRLGSAILPWLGERRAMVVNQMLTDLNGRGRS